MKERLYLLQGSASSPCAATRIERIGFFDGCSKKKIPKSLKERLYLLQDSVSSPQESKWFLIVARKENF